MTPQDRARLAGTLLQDAVLKMQDGRDCSPEVEAALRMIGEGTGENKYRHAASIVGGIKLGRHKIDDSAALAKIASYPSWRKREAPMMVAKEVAPAGATDKQVKAIAARLRRKARTERDKLLKSTTQTI
jgi:hypothetical protein